MDHWKQKNAATVKIAKENEERLNEDKEKLLKENEQQQSLINQLKGTIDNKTDKLKEARAL